MSKTATGLIEWCKKAVENDVQYIYGTKMQVLTYAQILSLQNTYGKSYVWDSDLSKAGKLCCDCSGLISSYTGVTRGSSNYNSTATDSATLAEVKAHWSKYVGWAFWMSGHIGVVSDTEGYYFAMDGSARNMVHYPLNKQSWTKAIKIADIDYTTTVTTETEEDNEMIDTTKIKINGTDYTVNRILKDGKNYVCLSDLSGKGFDVGYDSSTKTPRLDNTVNDAVISIDGAESTIKSVNIGGYTYSKIRELAEKLGNLEIDYKDKTVIITTKE
ncbi:MAG: hypothetical protein LUC92_08725 [Clostridiales bacterium]|nr:hypothetical protein [Clostridiales bacterium]